MTLIAPDLEARKGARTGLVGVRETRAVPFGGFELREAANGTGGSDLTFTGYACRTNATYEMADMFGPYTEVVRSGAFTKTLSEGADVAFLVNHEGLTLARTKSGTMTLAEDAEGLHVEARLDLTNPLVQQLRSAMDRGDVDEMSFAFRVMQQEWSPDYEQRDIIEVSINKGDVSAVNYGANPHTAGATLRSLSGRLPEGLDRHAYIAALTELRAGAAISAANFAALQGVLTMIAGADALLDDAIPALAEVLGVPNPDVDEPEDDEVEDDPADTGMSTYSLNRNKALASASRRRR